MIQFDAITPCNLIFFYVYNLTYFTYITYFNPLLFNLITTLLFNFNLYNLNAWSYITWHRYILAISLLLDASRPRNTRQNASDQHLHIHPHVTSPPAPPPCRHPRLTYLTWLTWLTCIDRSSTPPSHIH